MKAVVFYNTENSVAEKIADDILKVANNCGILSEKADLNYNSCNDIDFAFVVGGDGTIIHHAKALSMFNKPILSINAGRVGYLANLEPSDIDKIKQLSTNNFTVEKRMLLKAELVLSNKTITDYCINDAVISKGALSQIIDITATIGSDMLTYRADGLIACTPTGSTAYSMSAGGPLIDPTIDTIMLTPICSRSFFSRPLLLDSKNYVTIRASRKNAEIFLTIDGEHSHKLEPNSYVRISKAPFCAQFIKINDNTFCSTICRKLLSNT